MSKISLKMLTVFAEDLEGEPKKQFMDTVARLHFDDEDRCSDDEVYNVFTEAGLGHILHAIETWFIASVFSLESDPDPVIELFMAICENTDADIDTGDGSGYGKVVTFLEAYGEKASLQNLQTINALTEPGMTVEQVIECCRTVLGDPPELSVS